MGKNECSSSQHVKKPETLFNWYSSYKWILMWIKRKHTNLALKKTVSRLSKYNEGTLFYGPTSHWRERSKIGKKLSANLQWQLCDWLTNLISNSAVNICRLKDHVYKVRHKTPFQIITDLKLLFHNVIMMTIWNYMMVMV